MGWKFGGREREWVDNRFMSLIPHSRTWRSCFRGVRRMPGLVRAVLA
jgi:hypothetical protein